MIDLDKAELDLEEIGRQNLAQVHRNLPTPVLYEQSIKNREGFISHLGPLVVRTGQYANRSLEDRFIVRDPDSDEKVWWSGRNKELAPENFKAIFYRVLAYLQNKDVYTQECNVGSTSKRTISLRIVTETAWHSLFVRNMFTPSSARAEGRQFLPDFSIVHVPGFQTIPEIDGTNSSACIILSLKHKLLFIGGTSYAHEIKDAVFTIMNYLIAQDECLSLRCAVNMGAEGDVALFMGRSGTGKTSLATCEDRSLVGDDHHGWSASGLESYERGCYAKITNLDAEDQPMIYECTRKFGTIMENVTVDTETRRVDLQDTSLTENARAAYPLPHIPNAMRKGTCGHPKNIFMLTQDPFGVLPPVARLTPQQAYFMFLSSYKPSLLEDEGEQSTQRVLSNACFGHTPLVIKPHDYARLFMEKIKRHSVQCWLMNTGFSGEPYGSDRHVPIETSRAIVDSVVSGKLEGVEFEPDPVFQFEIPKTCPGIDDNILNPRNMARDQGEYELRANGLATDFMDDFSQFTDFVPESVKDMLSHITLLEDSLDIMEQFRITI